MTNLIETTSADLKDVSELEGRFTSGTYRFPKSAYRGELRTHGPQGGQHIANIYCLDHEVFIATPREYGTGEIVKMLPGSFSPKQFERCGGYNVSSTRRVDFWRFKA